MSKRNLSLILALFAAAVLLVAIQACSRNGNVVSHNNPGLAPVTDAPVETVNENESEMWGIIPAPENGDDLVLPEGAEPIPFEEETEPFEGMPASELPEEPRTASAPGDPKMPAPTNVVAWDGTFNDRVRVTWTHPVGEQPTVYYIYRSITMNDPNPAYIGGRSYPGRVFDDTMAVPGTKYYYKVKSHKTGWNDSVFSNEDVGWRSDRMNFPTNVTASDGTYNNYVYVYWTHPANEVPAVYYVYRSETPNDPNPAYIGGRSYPGRTFQDWGAVPGIKYWYKVKSHKTGFKLSFFSNEHRGWKTTKMMLPINVIATEAWYMDKVRVSWSHPTMGVVPGVYYIYRSETPDNPNPTYIGGRSYPGTYFDDATAVGGTEYYYKVKSHKTGYNDSVFSNEDLGWRGVWDITLVDESTLYIGAYSSLALDSNEYPHVSYVDATNSYLMYAYFDGSNWNTETVDNSGGVSGSPTSIALDANDYPHISYADSNNYYLKYAYWDGSSWNIETVDNSGDVDGGTSLQFDSNGYPHIAYVDNNNYYLMYANWDGSSWTTAAVDISGNVYYYSVSLALDVNDYPHISYVDFNNNNLLYTYFDGTDWQYGNPDNGDVDTGYNSLVLDANGYPHIAYVSDTDNDLMYVAWDGINWNIQTVEGGISAYELDLELDSYGFPHISYNEYDAQILRYARWSGSEWEFMVADDTSADTGWYTSMELDANDLPHISYYNATEQALMYANLE